MLADIIRALVDSVFAGIAGTCTNYPNTGPGNIFPQNSGQYDGSCRAAVGLSILALALSVTAFIGALGLLRRVKVVSNAASVAPLAAAPMINALSHPTAISILISVASIFAHIAWLQWLIISHNYLVSAHSSLALSMHYVTKWMLQDANDGFTGGSYNYSWSTGLILVFIAGIFLSISSFSVRRAGFRIMAAGNLANHATYHAQNAFNAHAASTPVPYAQPVSYAQPVAYAVPVFAASGAF
jgi:hypothetical protein